MKFKHTAAAIKRLRERAGITKAALAAVIGVHPQIWVSIERGIRPLPAKHIYLISHALDASIDDFIGPMVKDKEEIIRAEIEKKRLARKSKTK